MRSEPVTTVTPGSEIFDRWATVYDDEPNPLLLLEDRTLPALLPPLNSADILDVGCGTGRWLRRFEAYAPHSLAGSDCSTAMLEHARLKVSAGTVLHHSDSAPLPGADVSRDLILASFLLSYIDDLNAFAAECGRILRPGGHVLISDMHPDTAAQRGWTRSFNIENNKVHLSTHSRSLTEILATFALNGFQLSDVKEPSFGAPERPVFERAGKLTEYESLSDTPAIYLLKLHKQQDATRASAPLDLRLTNTHWAANSGKWSNTRLAVADGLVSSKTTPRWSLDLDGYVLLPGLVNAHDHLEFALFPNIGRSPNQPPYENASQWAAEIHTLHGDLIRKHQAVPLATRLWFGALRNLLCGVTTVCHHNPIHPELTAADFPVHVVKDFNWAHSLTFGQEACVEQERHQSERPFILHAAEGTDGQSRAELFELDRRNLLDHRTVLVHGLALNEDDIDLLNDRGTALILCPTSNHFLFGRTPSANMFQQAQRIALGSDSPLTSAGDLTDEIHCLSSQQISPHLLYNLVTKNAASILRLDQGEGRIGYDLPADLIAARDFHRSPAETLACLTLQDIELVFVGGHVQVISPTLYDRLPAEQRTGLHLLKIATIQRWVRAPLPTLFASAEAVLGSGNIRIGNKEASHVTTH